jgi:phosphate transport system ATP-binding protein
MPETIPTPTVRDAVATPAPRQEKVIEIKDLNFSYGANHVLHDVSLDIPGRAVTAFHRPSGCGKTTLLRCLNRMNDLVDNAKISSGSIKIEDVDINAPGLDVVDLRRVSGWCSRSRIPSRNRSTTTSPTGFALPA